jgi:Fic family protein
VQEDKTHQTVELCRNLDERLLLIQERSKNLENRTDAFVTLSNEILTEVSMMDHATGGGDAHTSEQIRKNSTSLRNLVNRVTQLVISIQSGCDETGLNVERGLRSLRDAVARLDDGDNRGQREAKDRLVQTALEYVKAYQATVDRDRRLWNRYVDIAHHAQQVELISRHISKTMDYTEETQSDAIVGTDAMVPRAS